MLFNYGRIRVEPISFSVTSAKLGIEPTNYEALLLCDKQDEVPKVAIFCLPWVDYVRKREYFEKLFSSFKKSEYLNLFSQYCVAILSDLDGK